MSHFETRDPSAPHVGGPFHSPEYGPTDVRHSAEAATLVDFWVNILVKDSSHIHAEQPVSIEEKPGGVFLVAPGAVNRLLHHRWVFKLRLVASVAGPGVVTYWAI